MILKSSLTILGHLLGDGRPPPSNPEEEVVPLAAGRGAQALARAASGVSGSRLGARQAHLTAMVIVMLRLSPS